MNIYSDVHDMIDDIRNIDIDIYTCIYIHCARTRNRDDAMHIACMALRAEREGIAPNSIQLK